MGAINLELKPREIKELVYVVWLLCVVSEGDVAMGKMIEEGGGARWEIEGVKWKAMKKT